MKGLRWHRIVYRILGVVLNPFLKWKLHYSYEKAKLGEGPYIILANHNTDYDCLLVGLAFPKHMYFVASEHMFRWGFISRLIEFLVDPIPRIKATAEVHTVMQILKRLKDGANICIFAEGDRSFSGETGEIHPSTGKLIKRSGASLITYRLDGGYFTSPRWSKTLRRGSMTGSIVKEYSAEELSQMSALEINRAIKDDLYVNAYEVQREHPVEYHGKRIAENLETALYLCPVCEGIATLKSSDDRFYCSCGLDLRYTTYGYLKSVKGSVQPFDTILDWSRWQTSRIANIAAGFKKLPSDTVVVSDEGQTLIHIVQEKKADEIGKGRLSLYNNRLVFDCDNGKQYSFELNSISDMAIHGQMVLIFSTTDRQSFEVRSDHPRSALKYLELYRALK